MFLQLTPKNIATLLIDGSVIFLLAGVLLETGVMRKRGRPDDKMFFKLIIMNMVMSVFDIITYLADEKTFTGARIFNMGGITLFYICLILLFMTWFHYCLIRFSIKGQNDHKKYLPLFIPGILMEALLVINIFTGWIFSVDSANVYHKGFLYIPLFVVWGYFACAGFIRIIRYRAVSGGNFQLPVWIFVLPIFIAFFVPFAIGGISMTAIGCAMSIVFTHLGSASEILNSAETLSSKEGAGSHE